MSTIYCLIKIDDINYKITMPLEDGRICGNFDDLLKAIAMDTDPDLKKYDFAEDFYIFEIFDKSLSEYVRIDGETVIENFSKIRVKILDLSEITPEPPVPVLNEDTLSFLELSDFKDDVELVELYAQSHVPDEEIVKLVDNSNVTSELFSIQNIRIKTQMVKSIIKFQGCFQTSNIVLDNIWEDIATDVKDSMGTRLIRLVFDRFHLGCVRIHSQSVRREFIALIGQYNRLLRMCQCLTAHSAQRLWPFFKTFHKQLKIEYMFPERGPSLKIMQKEFDNAKKIDNPSDNV